jgi:hypothetical protein
MAETKEHPVTDCIRDRAVQLVVVLLLDRLSLLQAVANIRQELCSVSHVPSDDGHTSFARLV